MVLRGKPFYLHSVDEFGPYFVLPYLIEINLLKWPQSLRCCPLCHR